MKRILVGTTFLVLLILVPSLHAQTTPSTKKQELINELLTVTDVDGNAGKIVDSVLDSFSKQYPKMIERMADDDPDLTDAQRSRMKASAGESFKRFTSAYREAIQKKIDLAKVVREISVIEYDKFFTEDELRDLIAFYKTPAGKKSISVLPKLLAESMQMTDEKIGPKLSQIAIEVMQQEALRLKASE